MKTRIAAMVMAIAAMTAAASAAAAGNDIEQLAAYTGMSERSVRMLVGNRTPFVEHRYTYERSLRKFRNALGKNNYDRLMSGQPIKRDNGVEVQLRVAKVEPRQSTG